MIRTMKLNVLDKHLSGQPWYSGGLKFTCSQCGNCCTGPPGYVWISKEEIVRLAEFLKITPQETVEKYCRKVEGRVTLKERRTPQGLYDCIFLKEQPDPDAASGDGSVPLRRKMCSVYSVRPLQCRTWPFWSENLATEENWARAAQRCPGIGQGKRVFSLPQITALKDAKDWPANPPTSKT
jgi:Fe-S-cluster containining protein